MARTKNIRHHQPDTGYSWIILICVFLVTFFHLGVAKVFGVFIPYLVDQLDMSTWAVGMACSIGIGLKALLGPVWAAATRFTSYRVLTICGAVISSVGLIFVSLSKNAAHLCCSMFFVSIGYGLPIVAKVVVLKDYFEDKFSLANGIAFTGGALGMVVFAPLMEFLIEMYGWRGAMLIFGAMNLNMCVAGAFMIQPDYISQGSSKTDRTSKSSSKQKDTTMCGRCSLITESVLNYLGFPAIAQYPILTVYLAAMGLHEMVVSGWVLFLVSYTITLGYSVQIASFLSALGGGGALIGRIVLGPFIDKGLISGRMMFFLLAVGGAIAMCCYPFTDVYWILSTLSFLAGFLLASTTPVFVVILKEITQEDSAGFAGAVGLHYMTRGIGMLTGGPLTGWLYDLSGSFYISFLTLGSLEAAVAMLTLVKSSFLNQCQGPET